MLKALPKRIWIFLALEAGAIGIFFGLFIGVNQAKLSSPDGLMEPLPIPEETPSGLSRASKPDPAGLPDRTGAGSKPGLPTEPLAPIAQDRLLARHATLRIHQVKLGENYWTIAKDHRIDIQTLIGANPDMPYISRNKQKLLILSEKGVLHQVLKGEKLKGIVETYKVPVDLLKKENRISWWWGLRPGDVLFVPGAKPVRMNAKWEEYFSKRGMFGAPFAKWREWTSSFGMRIDPITGDPRAHRGMDFRAGYGDDVFASAGGKVIFVGVSGGYGNLIQVSHGNGYITYYGHLSQMMVKQGQKVRRGQRVGKVGATGRVTGPHLHFEIRKNGKPINPLPLI